VDTHIYTFVFLFFVRTAGYSDSEKEENTVFTITIMEGYHFREESEKIKK